MSFLYIWQPTGITQEQAADQFRAILSRQQAVYEDAFGYAWTLHTKRISSVLIGQLQFDTGITGWQPWVEQNGSGLAWSGVCESHLGSDFDAATTDTIIRTLHTSPEQLANWSGKFGVCSWHENAVRLTVGATEAPPFWYAEGPRGWAIGNRAHPILDMVGCPTELNLDAAALYIAFGYLVGNNALLKHATRLPTRRQITFTAEHRPQIERYVSMAAYLALPERAATLRDHAQQCAERLVTRARQQLAHSSNPRLLLTGGRDSRCIAGAVAQAGFRGVAQTTGTSKTPDARVAAQICDRLGFEHYLNQFGSHTLPMSAISLEGARRWMRVSEGLETMRNAVFFQEFFRRELPYPATREQLFHGIGGEITRGVNYPLGYDLDAAADLRDVQEIMVTKKIPDGLALRQPLAELYADVLRETDAELDGLNVSLAQWLDFFYWQNRDLHWGEDFMSARDLIYWHWTPLIDRRFVQAAWQLAPRDKLSNRFIHEVTAILAPQLRDIPYDHGDSYVIAKRVARKVLKQLSRFDKRFSLGLRRNTYGIDGDPALLRFWNEVFFGSGDHVWRDLIDEAQVRYLITTNPSSDILWSTASVELVAQAHCR